MKVTNGMVDYTAFTASETTTPERIAMRSMDILPIGEILGQRESNKGHVPLELQINHL